ncbi:hypothetical protein WOSG25_090460 [Weissella oryzae SG25]|uniref:Uncharacterized protein n=1 Tax=Weissella oryzae (strain DSM 25784 / JCM 18191 / LMG 30913 / SG25) TaxID=1329250 RepID=A0A069CV67_WEIOS|nr:hypothetical protein WOSG25_090460 [Weissella oryzae SG25]
MYSIFYAQALSLTYTNRSIIMWTNHFPNANSKFKVPYGLTPIIKYARMPLYLICAIKNKIKKGVESKLNTYLITYYATTFR